MISDTPEVVRDNFRFLLVEAMAQVSHLRAALDQGSLEMARKVLDRIGYADNLKMRVRDGCMDAIKNSRVAREALTLRAIESLAVDLERITLLCHDCVRQYETLGGRKRRRCIRHAKLLNHVEQALELLNQATSAHETDMALKITRIKGKIDRDYKRLLGASNSDLKRRKDPAPVLVSIFMAQRIEEMGNALQSMGDAVISANMGHHLNAGRYHSLSATVEHLQGGKKKRALSVKPLAQTRSGSAISGTWHFKQRSGFRRN